MTVMDDDPTPPLADSPNLRERFSATRLKLRQLAFVVAVSEARSVAKRRRALNVTQRRRARC
jgi:hypothetical protein